MEIFELINRILGIIFIICYAYQFLYILVPFLKKDKPLKAAIPHRIGILISARNEETVIGNLIESIKNQSYNKELITIFVVADNCTDNTAEISKSLGAIVYERYNTQKIGKGYALEFLYENIVNDYGDSYFDAYLVLDADNVLDVNYIEEMNKTFSNGYEILTSYRNSKNYGDNWISAGYGLWFLRESEYLNHARMLLNTSCAVSGTGFMFASDVIREVGGWKFFLLTEDIEFTIHNVTKGRKIGYASKAYLYDEQPTTFVQSWNQRLRWSRGYLQVWGKYGGKLIRNIFSKNFTSGYDMTMTILPALIISILTSINIITGFIYGAITMVDLTNYSISVLFTLLSMYSTLWIIGFITVITEWKRIHTSAFKKILYTFTFPLFMFTYIPISFVALFKKVKWTPIEHKRAVTLDEITEKSDKNN